ncbi:MAG: MarR family transcriptional regulator [Proteobacteria bacterium]|nr:MarR family transcriptional regulator [Pseudomonadota bacterium]MBU1715356.1 MarR family transcriptional regulator [Pseudomonadota bacterium]
MDCCKENPLGRLIYLTAQEMKNFAEKNLKPYKLTLEQLHLLKNMPDDSGMSQRQIGDLVNKTPANITRILDRLESKSLIIRKSDPADRRASLVFLTDKGKSIIKKVSVIFESLSTNFLHDISLEEQQIIKNAFSKISLNLQRMTAESEKQETV